jgi:hypothetical protein
VRFHIIFISFNVIQDYDYNLLIVILFIYLLFYISCAVSVIDHLAVDAAS